jgi:hypothetical protein
MPINDSELIRLRRTFRLYLFRRRHSALLAAIIALFAVRPLISSDGAGPLIFSIVFMLLMLVALYNINTDELVGERSRLLAQSRRRRIIGWVLALAAIVERLAMMLMPGSTIGFGDITPIT